MNWSAQIQNAVDYIEMNLTEKIDIKLLAAQNFSSVYHFQRVFTIFTGYTLGQYIRFRRMTLAGADLAAGNEKVINIALKYGYENPDSFTKTFKKFHGILPSLVQEQREMLKIFPKINLDTLLESEQKMMYRIEEKKAIHITGYSSRFGGDPSERYEQQHHFMVDGETRFIRYALQGMACDCSTEYGVVYHFDNAGYEFLIGTIIPEYFREHLSKTVGMRNAETLTTVSVPAQKYLVAETPRSALCISEHLDIRRQILTECFDSAKYQLAESPEITVFHYDRINKDNSYIELWLPIEDV